MLKKTITQEEFDQQYADHLIWLISVASPILEMIPPDFKKSGRCLDLKFHNLSNLVMTNLSLTHANFTDCTISNCDISNSDLASVSLSNSAILDSNLPRVNLTKAILNRSKIINCNLSYCNFHDAYMTGLLISNTDISYSNMVDSNFSAIDPNSDLESCKISHCNMSNSFGHDQIDRLDLFGTDLTGTKINPDDLTGTNLIWAMSFKELI